SRAIRTATTSPSSAPSGTPSLPRATRLPTRSRAPRSVPREEAAPGPPLSSFRRSLRAAIRNGVSLHAGPYEFRHVTYDSPSDVPYAALEGPRPRGGQERPSESHLLRYDGDGEFFGVVLVEPRAQLERDGAVFLSLPSGDRVRVQGIEALVLRPDPA